MIKTAISHQLAITLAGVLALLVTSARADTFGSGGNAFTIDFVTIGDPGNANDNGTTDGSFSPYGGVSYTFQTGTYEISKDIINKANILGGLFITQFPWARESQPATFISWNEAARFVNWLNTSSGYPAAYKFAVNPGDMGYTSNAVANANLVLWTPSDAGYDASNLYRNSNAHYFLPSADEWYKAAFYSGSGNVYYNYATGSDAIPTAVASGTGAGTVVCGGVASVPADITLAGGLSHYGTMGQAGNVYEWNESAITAPNDVTSENRALRGGAWGNTIYSLSSSFLYLLSGPPDYSASGIGFRVASVVPEPSSARLMFSASLLALAWRRRRAAL